MSFRKKERSPLRKCTGRGQKSIWNNCLHFGRYHWNLLLKPNSPRIYNRSFRNSLYLYLRACAFRKWRRPPSEMHAYRPKVYLNSSLTPQPLLLKRASMPPSKDPFSANIHPNILQFAVHIHQDMCFRKIERTPFENASVGATNPFEITVRHPYSKGPFSANIHPIIPKLSVPIPQGMCFQKMAGSSVRKCTCRGQKSTSYHRKDSGRLLAKPLKVHFPEVISPRICIWSFPPLLCV